MISLWHLSAVCCIPHANPERRRREKEIFRNTETDDTRTISPLVPVVRGRWESHQRVTASRRS